MSISELFELRKNIPFLNTSYPLSPNDWNEFRIKQGLPFDHEKNLSFYIHIPFCKHLCSFCEYTRMRCPDETIQRKYLQTIANNIHRFKLTHTNFTLQGFDIGGGTPTSLSEYNFNLLMNIYDNTITDIYLSEDYEPSIEGTFNTLSKSKLDRIVKSNIRRLSLGVQSSSYSVLQKQNRVNPNAQFMYNWLNNAWDSGIKKINLDFMYGLENQDSSNINIDLELIYYLKPQQVTLYELRPNMISAKHTANQDVLYSQYTQYFEGLIKLGYNAQFGQNTFSIDSTDCGVSSYLRKRMLECMPYKGFGLSAQSMNSKGVSYNVGKSATNLLQLISLDKYDEEYTYILPLEEIAAKYLAISAYNGSFSLDILQKLGINIQQLNDSLEFCQSNDLIYIDSFNRVHVTKKGFKHYGALFSLFYAYNRNI